MSNPEIHILSNLEDIRAALSYLSDFSVPVCVDVETDGLLRFRKTIGIGLSKSETEAFYVPLWIWNGTELVCPWESQKALYDELRAFFKQPLKFIGHNVVFDVISLENELGVNIINNVWCDTQALAHLVYNEEGPLGLKPLSTELFNLKASESQDEVKESVKRNGGKVSKTNFELFKADWQIIGKYCALDCYFTYRLYNKLYPELDRQNFSEIWTKEIKPLSKVTYELNSQGFKVDVPYFQALKTEIEATIASIEQEIFRKIEPQIQDYINNKVRAKVKVTPRSECGKVLISNGFATKINASTLEITNPEAAMTVMRLFLEKQAELFNLDSGDDKAYLIYDVLGLPCEKTTESGKRATDADTLDELCTTYESKSEVLKLLLQRSKEKKILSTYVMAILENQVDGKIYTSFKQTGTISGRYSSGDPINFQNLPRDDKRIKKGFICEPHQVIIGSDYESAEPKAFAYVSGEQKLKDIFKHGDDFYSTIAIDTEGLVGVSANPDDETFLKKVDPQKRQSSKEYSLGIAYGMRGGKLAKVLNIDYMEAQELVDRYLTTYPRLRQWMKRSEELAIKQGYVTTIYGRKRRAHTAHSLYKKYGITEFSKKSVEALVNRYGLMEDALKLYLQCNNNLNNAKNFQIQGICASIINKAMLEFIERRESVCPSARVVMMVHDEIILVANKSEAEKASALLQDCMVNNEFARRIDVAMKADPIITEKSLAEAK